MLIIFKTHIKLNNVKCKVNTMRSAEGKWYDNCYNWKWLSHSCHHDMLKLCWKNEKNANIMKALNDLLSFHMLKCADAVRKFYYEPHHKKKFSCSSKNFLLVTINFKLLFKFSLKRSFIVIIIIMLPSLFCIN